MSDRQDEQSTSPSPRFWLEFRTLDDAAGAAKPQPSLQPQPTTPPPQSRPASAPATTFPQFARLPAELRLKIWSYLVQPRIVIACCLQRDDDDLAQRRHEELRARTRAAGAPALLHVNREARDVGLSHYELTFSWKISSLHSDTPASRPAQVWFNYALDALYLAGKLEAYDSYGFNSPMVHFMRRQDTRRVRHVACALAELGFPEQESDQILGCLWHVADRFAGVDRLLLTVSDADEEQMKGCLMRSADNIVQRILKGWMGGTTVTNTKMADKQMLLIREKDLAECIASHQKQAAAMKAC